MHSIDPARVAIYIRWSTDDQSEGTTLAVQRERCHHFLLSQGWAFDEGRIYIDEGFSGGNLERPALTRLRADVARGAIQCVVVYKIDRLSRSVVDIVDLVLKEWEGRCFVRSTTEEINTLTPAGKMFFYLLISFAEYERNLIRERTMSGKVKRAEQGFNPGFRPPFGYVRGPAPGTFAICPDEAEVVRQVFAMYVGGTGPAQIARLLGSRGAGRAWTPLAVRRMLSNPAYAGVLAYGRRNPEQMLARVEGAFPAIVDRRIWEAAQTLRRGRRPAMRALGRPYLLAGLARCQCGAPVVGKGAGRRRYYCCARRRAEGEAGCGARHIPADEQDEAVVRQAQALLAVSGLADAVARSIAAQRSGEAAVAIARERRVLAALQARRRRLSADYRGGALPAVIYVEELAALAQEEAAARLRLAQREQAEPPAPDAIWQGLSSDQKRRLLGQMAESITLWRCGREAPVLTVRWRADLSGLADRLVSLSDHLS